MMKHTEPTIQTASAILAPRASGLAQMFLASCCVDCVATSTMLASSGTLQAKPVAEVAEPAVAVDFFTVPGSLARNLIVTACCGVTPAAAACAAYGVPPTAASR